MVTLLICLLIKCNLFAKKFLFTQGSTYNLGTEAIFEQFQWKGLYPITPYCRWRAIHSYCVEMHFEGNFYPNAVVECGVWAMTRHQWLDDLLGRMITHENSYKLPLIDKLVSVSWILDINNYGKTRGLSQAMACGWMNRFLAGTKFVSFLLTKQRSVTRHNQSGD